MSQPIYVMIIVAIVLLIGGLIGSFLLWSIVQKPRGMDFHTFYLFQATKWFVIGMKDASPDDVRPARPTPEMELIRVGFGVWIPDTDHDFEGLKQWQIKIVEFFNWISPFMDHWVVYADVDKTKAFVGKYVANLFPKGNHVWDLPTTDESLELMCLRGLFAHRLRKVEIQKEFVPDEEELVESYIGSNNINSLNQNKARVFEEEVYVVRFNFMQRYEVRKDCAVPGGDAYFSKDGKIIRINIHGKDYYPGKASWQAAKFHFRSSGLICVTLMDHFAQCHVLVGNAACRSTRGILKYNHPLRTLLQPFTFGISAVNRSGYPVLFKQRGLFQRVSPFTKRGYDRIMMDGVFNFRYGGFPDQLKARGVYGFATEKDTGYLFGSDGLQLWNIFNDFVQRYLDKVGTIKWNDKQVQEWSKELRRSIPGFKIPLIERQEDLVELITYLIWNGTAYHEAVGNVKEYLRDPNFCATRWRPGDVSASVQNSFQTSLIAIMTSVRTPPLLDKNCYAHMFEGEEKGKQVMERLQKDLRQFSDDMVERNKFLDFAFNTFNPTNLEISVAI